MRKIASVVEIKPECIDEYKRLHANVWPEVLAVIKEANIINYSIYLRDINAVGYFLFSYFEYVGTDYKADMARIAAAPITQDWWAQCKPCLRPLDGVTMEECWAPMKKVFDFAGGNSDKDGSI